ncbi:MAG: hypothetical protein Q9169_008690 [Polycauliona sp. 2 TL-2023]
MIHWPGFTGFTGSGLYVILNRASLMCIQLDGVLRGHMPHDEAQIWRIQHMPEAKGKGDVYSIQNVYDDKKTLIPFPEDPADEAADDNASTGVKDDANNEATSWTIDTKSYALEPGKMVNVEIIQINTTNTDSKASVTLALTYLNMTETSPSLPTIPPLKEKKD